MKRVLVLAMVTGMCTALAGVDRVHGAEPGQTQWGSGPVPQAGVCFFDDVNFGGRYFCVRAGEELVQMPPGMNDRISSLRIIGNVDVTVFKDISLMALRGVS